MKILHIVHGYPPSIGGSQWLVKNLSEQLVSRYQDEVTVFTTTAYEMDYFWGKPGPVMPAGVEHINGVIVRRFAVFNRLSTLRMLLAGVATRLYLPYNDWLRTVYNGPLVFGLRKAVANSSADVVMAMAFPLLHMYDALAGARRGGMPIVLIGALHVADQWGYDRKMIYQAIQEADAYIALTTFERNYLVERGITPDKITVAGGGVDITPYLKADGQTASIQYGLGDDPVVAIIGKQNARKRFDLLLAAMPRVWATYPRVRLLIAGGQGSYSEQIGRIINDLPEKQQAQVTILSDFPESDKPTLLAACDLFVLPSGEESFGIAFIEAWAGKKPVIGAKIGAVPSVIHEGVDGLLYTYEDPASLAQAMLYLLDHPQAGARMGEAGHRKVLKNYTWPIVAGRVRSVYEQVLSHNNR
jgi:glycosyltransferase involved in cell wall biosynthesis